MLKEVKALDEKLWKELKKISLEQLEETRKRKRSERGGFDKRIILEETK